MWLRTTIIDGRAVSAFAASIAASSAARSFASSTCWTCQPWAAMRAPRSSAVNETDVVPSIVIRLSS